MRKSIVKKGIVVTIITLFIIVSIIPSISGNTVKINSLYVNKSESNSKYINSGKIPEKTNTFPVTEDNIYVTTDEYGLHEYACLKPNSNYDQSDNLQNLKFKKIERTHGVSKTKTTDNNPKITISGSILYVGGSGPNNYTNIQDAINDASDGDTIFVYDDSSPYDESIIIDKSIQLIGENKYSTVISGSKLDRFVNFFSYLI